MEEGGRTIEAGGRFFPEELHPAGVKCRARNAIVDHDCVITSTGTSWMDEDSSIDDLGDMPH